MSGIVDQLVRFGKVTRPILGIKFAPDQSVEQLGVSGVLVLDAPANGPAGKAVFSSLFLSAFLFLYSYRFQYSIMVPRTYKHHQPQYFSSRRSDRLIFCRACNRLSAMRMVDLYWET